MSERQLARRQARARTARRGRRTTYGSLSGPRPDRVALWAVALGVFLILVATATSRGATTGGAAVAPAADGGSVLGPNPGQDAELATGAARNALVARMSVQVATLYGPGFYGRRTACGVRLRRATQGVAHKRLPCGTSVAFYYKGRLKTVPVIDRGPYAHGISWDLTAATARSLGLERTSTLRSLVWRLPGGEPPASR